MQSHDNPLMVPTFAQATEAVSELRVRGYAGRAEHWRRPLEIHAYARLRDLRVCDIEPQHVAGVLLDVRARYPRLEPRVRQGIATVMWWAVAHGFRPDNPCDAALAALPPARPPQSRPYPSLPHPELSEALARVREASAWIGARLLLEFLALTVMRPAIARGALWSEVDLEAAMWTVPPTRMHSRRAHRVPLSSAALSVLRDARDDVALRDARCRDGHADLLFPSARGRELTAGTLSAVLRRLHIPSTPYAFRHSFADWAAEAEIRSVVAAMCLAHDVSREFTHFNIQPDFYTTRVGVMERWGRLLAPDRSGSGSSASGPTLA